MNARPFPRQRTGVPAAAAGELASARAAQSLALPPETRDACRLDRWDPRAGEPGYESLAVAFWAARRMAMGYQTIGTMLTLAGETGVGKSHLALAVAWAWVERFEREPWLLLTNAEARAQLEEKLDRLRSLRQAQARLCQPQRRFRWLRLSYPTDHGVRFARVGDLLDLLQEGYEDGSYHALLRECQSCRLLVLDDLGHQRDTPWRVEMVDRIVDARYRSHRWTVVTTNLPGEQLPPRIASRLRDRATGFVAAIEAGDYRPRKARSGRRVW